MARSLLVPQPGLNPRPGIENTESQPLDHQEFPEGSLLAQSARNRQHRPQLRVELWCCLGPLGPARGPRECGFGMGWAVKPAGRLQMHRELMEQARGPSASSPASSSESRPTSVFPAASKRSAFSPWLLLLLRLLKQSLNPAEKARGCLPLAHQQ